MRRPSILLVMFASGCSCGDGGGDVPTGPAPCTEPTGEGTVHEDEAITGSVRWDAEGSPHRIEGTVVVAGDGARLDVDRCAVVEFGAGAALVVGEGGEGILTAHGDAADPIPFVSAAASPAPGDFVGVRFGPGTQPATRLENVLVDDAGGPSGRPEGDGGIVAWGDETASPAVTLVGVTVTHSASDGIVLSSATFDEDSSTLDVDGCAGHPFVVDATQASEVPVGRYVDNGVDAIGIRGGTIAGTVTWREAQIPFHVLGDIVVEGEDVSSLSIAPNVAVWMDAGTAIEVGQTLPGGFVASADLDHRIVISGVAGDETPGTWRGIVLGPQSGQTQMSHVNLSGAGGPDPEGGEATALLVHGDGPTGPTLEVHDLQIHGSAGYGVSIRDGATMDGDSEYLRVNDTADYIVHVDAAAAGGLPQDTSGENDARLGILVEPGTVSTTTQWAIQDVPYVIAGPVAVEGSPPPILTLNEGSTLRFQAGAWLEIGRGDSGDVRAAGTADQPITLTADGDPVPGAWVGILMLQGMSNETVFYQTVVEWAGAANEFSGETCGSSDAGNFVVVGVAPEFVEAPAEAVHDSVIRGSAGYGVAMDRDIAADMTDPGAGNTFDANTLGDQTPSGC